MAEPKSKGQLREDKRRAATQAKKEAQKPKPHRTPKPPKVTEESIPEPIAVAVPEIAIPEGISPEALAVSTVEAPNVPLAAPEAPESALQSDAELVAAVEPLADPIIIPEPVAQKSSLPEAPDTIRPAHANRLADVFAQAQAAVLRGVSPGHDLNNAQRLAQQRVNEFWREHGYNVAGLRTSYESELRFYPRAVASAQAHIRENQYKIREGKVSRETGEYRIGLYEQRIKEMDAKESVARQALQDFDNYVRDLKPAINETISQTYAKIPDIVRNQTGVDTPQAQGRTTDAIRESLKQFSNPAQALRAGAVDRQELVSLGVSNAAITRGLEYEQQLSDVRERLGLPEDAPVGKVNATIAIRNEEIRRQNEEAKAARLVSQGEYEAARESYEASQAEYERFNEATDKLVAAGLATRTEEGQIQVSSLAEARVRGYGDELQTIGFTSEQIEEQVAQVRANAQAMSEFRQLEAERTQAIASLRGKGIDVIENATPISGPYLNEDERPSVSNLVVPKLAEAAVRGLSADLRTLGYTDAQIQQSVTDVRANAQAARGYREETSARLAAIREINRIAPEVISGPGNVDLAAAHDRDLDELVIQAGYKPIQITEALVNRDSATRLQTAQSLAALEQLDPYIVDGGIAIVEALRGGIRPQVLKDYGYDDQTIFEAQVEADSKTTIAEETFGEESDIAEPRSAYDRFILGLARMKTPIEEKRQELQLQAGAMAARGVVATADLLEKLRRDEPLFPQQPLPGPIADIYAKYGVETDYRDQPVAILQAGSLTVSPGQAIGVGALAALVAIAESIRRNPELAQGLAPEQLQVLESTQRQQVTPDDVSPPAYPRVQQPMGLPGFTGSMAPPEVAEVPTIPVNIPRLDGPARRIPPEVVNVLNLTAEVAQLERELPADIRDLLNRPDAVDPTIAIPLDELIAEALARLDSHSASRGLARLRQLRLKQEALAAATTAIVESQGFPPEAANDPDVMQAAVVGILADSQMEGAAMPPLGGDSTATVSVRPLAVTPSAKVTYVPNAPKTDGASLPTRETAPRGKPERPDVRDNVQLADAIADQGSRIIQIPKTSSTVPQLTNQTAQQLTLSNQLSNSLQHQLSLANQQGLSLTNQQALQQQLSLSNQLSNSLSQQMALSQQLSLSNSLANQQALAQQAAVSQSLATNLATATRTATNTATRAATGVVPLTAVKAPTRTTTRGVPFPDDEPKYIGGLRVVRMGINRGFLDTSVDLTSGEVKTFGDLIAVPERKTRDSVTPLEYGDTVTESQKIKWGAKNLIVEPDGTLTWEQANKSKPKNPPKPSIQGRNGGKPKSSR